MHEQTMVFSLCMIFMGAAILSTLALYTRQSLLIAYMAVGAIIGPFGLKWIDDPAIVSQTGEVGIIFLLFLIGLNLYPQKLWQMLRKTTLVTVLSSLIFLVVGIAIGKIAGFNMLESLVVGFAVTFSSTIIALKLLPTTVLHHQHTGELMISILLMQDILAILVLLALSSLSVGDLDWIHIVLMAVGLPTLLLLSVLFQRYLLTPLLLKFDKIQEYIFLLAIAWCLGLTELSGALGLSREIGALIAGVSVASSPIALYIAESLRPLRDFFLVIFFFAIGANFDPSYLKEILLPACGLAAILLILKPLSFQFLLLRLKESKKTAWEVGVRLGQASEFSLLVAYLASDTGLIRPRVSYLIQAATLVTFIISTYWVVIRYQTPVAMSEKLRRD